MTMKRYTPPELCAVGGMKVIDDGGYQVYIRDTYPERVFEVFNTTGEEVKPTMTHNGDPVELVDLAPVDLSKYGGASGTLQTKARWTAEVKYGKWNVEGMKFTLVPDNRQ